MCRTLHRKEVSQLYILLFLFGGRIMDITGKPDCMSDAQTCLGTQRRVKWRILISTQCCLHSRGKIIGVSNFPHFLNTMMMEHGKYFY